MQVQIDGTGLVTGWDESAALTPTSVRFPGNPPADNRSVPYYVTGVVGTRLLRYATNTGPVLRQEAPHAGETTASGRGTATPFHSVPLLAGTYYYPLHDARTAMVLTANRLFFVPLWVPRSLTVDRLSAEVTALTAGTLRCGIYNDTGDGLPGRLLADLGGQSTGAVGVLNYDPAGPLTLQAGVWWLAAVGSASATVRAHSGGLVHMPRSSWAGAAIDTGWYQTATDAPANGLPTQAAVFASFTLAGTLPMMGVRVGALL